MGINSYITDTQNHATAQVLHLNENDDPLTRINRNALIVATHPLKMYEHTVVPFTNPTFGSSINIAVSFGTPTTVYAENVEWMTSAISGTWDFASTDFAQAGSVSIDATATGNNDIVQFDNGADLDLSNSISITGWVYITRWDAVGTKRIDIIGWDTGTDLPVGVAADIADHVEATTLNVWQQFSIILSDMELVEATIDSLRVTTIFTGGGGLAPKYYLDNIQIEQKGDIDPQTFAVKPDLGTWLHVLDFTIFIADNDFDSTADGGTNNVTSPTLPNIPYDSLLGETLAVGLSYQLRQEDNIIFNHIIKDLSDFLVISGTKLNDYGCTGQTNTWITLKLVFSEPVILKPELEEQLCIVVSEDLSGLSVLKSSANCKVEIRE